MKILVILLVAVAAFFLIARMRTNSGNPPKTRPAASGPAKAITKTGKTSPSTEQHPYQSTAIELGEGACEAARALAEKAFLDSDKATPLLPLPGCTAAKCNCKYVRLRDRRGFGQDRRFGSSMMSTLYNGNEKENRRESKGDRRNKD